MITNECLVELVRVGKACVESGTDCMDRASSRALGELAEELLRSRPGAEALAGLQVLRRLALGRNETLNILLTDLRRGELEAALRWLDAIQRKVG